ncbi:ECF transporter S component [Weissella coleopterorum]|uniref:ECF transporter S component n=1 Tax=Weissella coleopterorum TaxID=2714949 RepID=A0A6G8B170_9LACO|nr:ECF transporter S component [Weissella coleopterorum]QIL50996.1 ECF transporter S component [Weissella coleopterorum]
MINKRKSTRQLVLTAMFMAIILLQCMVPWLGFIPINPMVRVTIIPFTVSLGGMLLGPRVGGLLGAVMGMYSFYHAWTLPIGIGSLMLRNPITALLPRILVGVIVGIIYIKLVQQKAHRASPLLMFLLGALAAIINTGLVIGLTWLHFRIFNTTVAGLPNHVGIIWMFTSIAGLNALIEVVVDGLLGMLVGWPILRYMQKGSTLVQK